MPVLTRQGKYRTQNNERFESRAPEKLKKQKNYERVVVCIKYIFKSAHNVMHDFRIEEKMPELLCLGRRDDYWKKYK